MLDAVNFFNDSAYSSKPIWQAILLWANNISKNKCSNIKKDYKNTPEELVNYNQMMIFNSNIYMKWNQFDKAEWVVSCLIRLWGNAVRTGLDDFNMLTKTKNLDVWISQNHNTFILFITCYFLFSNHSFLVHLLFVPEWQTKILNYRTFANLWVFFSQAFLGLYLCMCSTAHTSLSSSEHLGNWKSSQVVHLNLAILRLGRVDSGMAAFKYSSLLITAEAGPFNLWSLAAGPPGHTLNTQACSP